MQPPSAPSLPAASVGGRRAHEVAEFVLWSGMGKGKKQTEGQYEPPGDFIKLEEAWSY